MKRSLQLLSMTLLSLATLSACARTPDALDAQTSGILASPVAAASAPVLQVAVSGAAVTATALPLVVVHKSASCGCCGAWVEHLRKSGFKVEVRDSDNLNPVKQRVGVPVGKGSCHTAEVGGYFVEGHVPADDIKRLLTLKPDAKGLLLPGMPAGSPGMELPDGTKQPYTVELVKRDGSTAAFARH